MDRYPATYTDARGSESTVIENDGTTLSVRIRGVEFVGDDIDALEPKIPAPEQPLPFTLNGGDLCSCRIEWRVPVPVHRPDQDIEGTLAIELLLGDPAPNGGIDREVLRIALEYDGHRVVGDGTSGWFEDELLSIQRQLPDGIYMKACINCLFSDYSPYGHGLFGSMMCFRNLKSEYLKVKTKAQFWSVHNRLDRYVQETYLCPEFERRVPGTGYRG